ncbi:MAG: hypothetical protein Unbinned627contig1001_16 [Prokaryotic dsDNA virus sp.]|nr:MAG: hypothetical protein Unbinned627contig1001_16 [Prokaryotic dsDNA virus sp.]
MTKKSYGSPKDRMMKKTTQQGDTRIRITLTKEQYAQAERIAKRHAMHADDVIQRYVLRCIADLSHP